ncbi:MAG: hypothetical protein PVH29_02165 [Candidatus Zixiibacteriota bacterium]|jgi:hypothetical protein
MSQEELLAKVAAVLNDAGVNYVVTGSVVTSLYGEPRYTQDADVLVVVSPGLGDNLSAAFPPPRYYAPADDIDESLKRRIIANIIDSETGAKVDLHAKTGDAFADSFFARRRLVEVAGVELWFPSPEDAILSKLVWARATGNGERHLRDARGVFLTQRPALDEGYLRNWAERLSVTDLLERVEAGGFE